MSSNCLLESLLSSEFSLDYLLQDISWGILSLTALQALWICVLSHFSHVQLFATPWTVAHQAPLSLGFSRQEYWSGLPFVKFPKSLVFKIVFLPEMATRWQDFFMPKSGSSVKRSLHERSLPGCKWEGNDCSRKKHPRAGVLLILPHYPSHPEKSQHMQKHTTEGAVVQSWGSSKEGDWRCKPQHWDPWRTGDSSKDLQPRGPIILWVHWPWLGCQMARLVLWTVVPCRRTRHFRSKTAPFLAHPSQLPQP